MQQSGRRLEHVVHLALCALGALLGWSAVWLVTGSGDPFRSPQVLLWEGGAVLTAVAWLVLRRPRWRDLGSTRWLLAVPAWAALSSLWALEPTLALYGAGHLLVSWLWLVMLAHELRRSYFARQFLLAVIAGATAEAAWAVAQWLRNDDLGIGKLVGESQLDPNQAGVAKVVVDGVNHIRSYGTFSHPNVLAALLSIAIFAVGTIVVWPMRRRDVQLRWVAVLTVLSAGLITTLSRVALVITAVNGTLVVLFAYRRWHRLPLAAGVAAAASAIMLALFLPSLLTRGEVADTARETGITNRTVGYSEAARMVAEQPFGVGANNFVTDLDTTRPDLPDYQRQPAHNVPLLILAELGVPIVTLVLWFVLRVGWRFHRLRVAEPRQNAINFSLFCLAGACIAQGLTDHFFWSLPAGQHLLTTVTAGVLARLPSDDPVVA